MVEAWPLGDAWHTCGRSSAKRCSDCGTLLSKHKLYLANCVATTNPPLGTLGTTTSGTPETPIKTRKVVVPIVKAPNGNNGKKIVLNTPRPAYSPVLGANRRNKPQF